MVNTKRISVIKRINTRMLKPNGYVETWFLTELKDKNKIMFGFMKELYGYCNEDYIVDERTGEIEKN